jgi:C4-type Zn-finger protein
MATNCEFCGYKDNEVKSGAAISEQGKRITIRCEDREDLSRDILKVSEHRWTQCTYIDKMGYRVKRLA